jgi:uncharacterized membrane protein
MKYLKNFLYCAFGVLVIAGLITLCVFAGFGENVLKAVSLVSGVYLFLFCKRVFRK